MSFFIIMRNFQLLILLGVFQCILGFDSQQTTIYSSRNLEFNCIPDEVDLRISEVSTNIIIIFIDTVVVAYRPLYCMLRFS